MASTWRVVPSLVLTSTSLVHLRARVRVGPIEVSRRPPSLTMSFTIGRAGGRHPSPLSAVDCHSWFAPSFSAMVQGGRTWEQAVAAMLLCAVNRSRYNPRTEDIGVIVRCICDYYDDMLRRYNFSHSRKAIILNAFIVPGDPLHLAPIRGLRTSIYGGGDHAEQEWETGAAATTSASTSCAICLEEYEVGVEMAEMPCGHPFHGRCLREWLQRRHTFPFCRFSLQPYFKGLEINGWTSSGSSSWILS